MRYMAKKVGDGDRIIVSLRKLYARARGGLIIKSKDALYSEGVFDFSEES